MYFRICGNTHFRVNSHMWKFFHILELIPTCGNSLKNVYFHICGNTHFRVNSHMWKFAKNCVSPHMRKYTKKSEFPRAEMQEEVWKSHMGIYTGLCVFPHMRKYTRKRESPHVEIHAERCITACGNTLNTAHFNTWQIAWQNRVQSLQKSRETKRQSWIEVNC